MSGYDYPPSQQMAAYGPFERGSYQKVEGYGRFNGKRFKCTFEVAYVHTGEIRVLAHFDKENMKRFISLLVTGVSVCNVGEGYDIFRNVLYITYMNFSGRNTSNNNKVVVASAYPTFYEHTSNIVHFIALKCRVGKPTDEITCRPFINKMVHYSLTSMDETVKNRNAIVHEGQFDTDDPDMVPSNEESKKGYAMVLMMLPIMIFWIFGYTGHYIDYAERYKDEERAKREQKQPPAD